MLNAGTLHTFAYGVKEAFPELNLPPHVTPASEQEVNELLTKSKLTARNLDQLWTLFFGSGNRKYADRVNEVAHGKTESNRGVVAAAMWSHSSVGAQFEEVIREMLTRRANA